MVLGQQFVGDFEVLKVPSVTVESGKSLLLPTDAAIDMQSGKPFVRLAARVRLHCQSDGRIVKLRFAYHVPSRLCLPHRS